MAPQLDPCHPDHQRFDAVGWSVATTLLAVTAAVLTAGVLGVLGTPLAWLLVLAALPSGLVPLVHWRRTRHDGERLPVGHLSEPWREVLVTAAAAARRIELDAAEAPPGAVADHLWHLHATACHHLRALHQTGTLAVGMAPADDTDLVAEGRVTAGRLVALADAADRLRTAQRRQLGPDPIAALTQATDALAGTLDDPALRPGPGPRPTGAD